MTGRGKGTRGESGEDPARYVGCCGAYCRTCRPFIEGVCRGCKLGYEEGGREIRRAKCAMKVCCFGERGFITCADCPDYAACGIIQGFFSKSGYKYKRYRQSIEFIRKHGYAKFIKIANGWKGAYGRLE